MKIIDSTLLNTVSEQAKTNSRLRMNYNFHKQMDEPVQRLLNALEPNTYLPPHRHLQAQKQEIFLVQRGSVLTFLFDDKGTITQIHEINPAKGVFGMEIEPDIWHSFIILETNTVIYEIKQGPFAPIDPKDMAPWAPKPQETEAAQNYIQELLSAYQPQYIIHPTAEVAPSATIGNKTIIENHTIIGENAKIGEQCKIHRNIYVDNDVQIGNKVKIQDNVMIPHGVTIEDGVFIGPGVAFTNDKWPRSITEDGELKTSEDWVCSETIVKYGASIGANATIVCGITIGEWAMIGAGAVVTKDVPAHAIVIGNPGRIINQKVR